MASLGSDPARNSSRVSPLCAIRRAAGAARTTDRRDVGATAAPAKAVARAPITAGLAATRAVTDAAAAGVMNAMATIGGEQPTSEGNG